MSRDETGGHEMRGGKGYCYGMRIEGMGWGWERISPQDEIPQDTR